MMGRYIIKLGKYYLEWSTVVDAPVSFGMKLDKFRDYYREEYGRSELKTLDGRLERVHQKGTSAMRDTHVSKTISGNRAGPDESELDIEEIYQAYCLKKPIRDGWLVPLAKSDD